MCIFILIGMIEIAIEVYGENTNCNQFRFQIPTGTPLLYQLKVVKLLT